MSNDTVFDQMRLIDRILKDAAVSDDGVKMVHSNLALAQGFARGVEFGRSRKTDIGSGFAFGVAYGLHCARYEARLTPTLVMIEDGYERWAGNAPIEPYVAFWNDVFATAVEGAIQHWCVVKDYTAPDDRGENEPSAVLVAKAGVEGADDWSGPVTLTPAVLAKAAERLKVDGAVAHMGERVRAHLLHAVAELDEGELDGSDADVLAQVAVFDEVIYG